MRVRLDDTWCDVATDNVSVVLADAARLAEKQGRIIVDVEADGVHWTDEQFTTADVHPLPDQLVLTTADPREAACQALSDADTALVVADDLQRDAAGLIEADQIQAAMTRLAEAFGIWGDVEKTVRFSAELMELPLDEMVVGDAPVSETIGRLGERLRMVISTLQARDPLGLSDTLLYELPEIVQEWRDLLEALKDRIGVQNP